MLMEDGPGPHQGIPELGYGRWRKSPLGSAAS